CVPRAVVAIRLLSCPVGQEKDADGNCVDSCTVRNCGTNARCLKNEAGWADCVCDRGFKLLPDASCAREFSLTHPCCFPYPLLHGAILFFLRSANIHAIAASRFKPLPEHLTASEHPVTAPTSSDLLTCLLCLLCCPPSRAVHPLVLSTLSCCPPSRAELPRTAGRTATVRRTRESPPVIATLALPRPRMAVLIHVCSRRVVKMGAPKTQRGWHPVSVTLASSWRRMAGHAQTHVLPWRVRTVSARRTGMGWRPVFVTLASRCGKMARLALTIRPGLLLTLICLLLLTTAPAQRAKRGTQTATALTCARYATAAPTPTASRPREAGLTVCAKGPTAAAQCVLHA
ncbi:unnamed protein product, partial [Closterium sp. Naga37s-1]